MILDLLALEVLRDVNEEYFGNGITLRRGENPDAWTDLEIAQGYVLDGEGAQEIRWPTALNCWWAGYMWEALRDEI